MICKQCGHELPEPPPGFCTYCGASTSEPFASQSMSSASANIPPRYYCPWEDRERLGFFNALWQTIKMVITQPVEFYQKLQPDGKLGSALGYGVIVGFIGILGALLWQIPFQALQFVLMAKENPAAAMMGPVMFIIIIFVLILFSPLLILIGIFITSAITHFFLWLLGGATNGYVATVRLVCYAMTTNIFNLVPLCGGYIAGIWQFVLEIIGLKVVHDTTYVKAIFAKIIPMLICCCCVVIIIAIIFSMIGLSISNPDSIRDFIERLTNR